VILALSRGLTDSEWNTFLEVMAAPPVETDPAREGARLAKALLDKKVSHVALVREIDLPGQDPQVAWMVRPAFGRLGRDVRALLALGDAKPTTLGDHRHGLLVLPQVRCPARHAVGRTCP
jgi:hypothetical protein